MRHCNVYYEYDLKYRDVYRYSKLYIYIKGNMIPKQVSHTPFKFQNGSSTSPESQNHTIET